MVGIFSFKGITNKKENKESQNYLGVDRNKNVESPRHGMANKRAVTFWYSFAVPISN